MREKQVVLFDLDGDSMAGITRSYQYALAHFGVEVENPDTLARFVGPSLYRTFAEEYGFAGERLQTAVAKYREYFAEKGVFEHSLYPGMSGDADQAVAALLAGQLSYDPDTVCSHHEHDHGHDCATHDCAQDHQGCPGNH